MEHYFTRNPGSQAKRSTISAHVRGFELVLEVGAGVFSGQRVDFGSRLLAETVKIEPDASVLDLGCGYGVLGIVIGKLAPAGSVTLVDVNERALELARSNCRRSGLSQARVLYSDGYASLGDERFDHIVTNPPIRAGKSVVYSFFEGAARHLRLNGSLWVVIQRKQGGPSARRKLEELFADVEDVARDAGYHVLRASRARDEANVQRGSGEGAERL